MVAHLGRPRVPGERHPGGKIKRRDEGDMRAPTLWRRIKDGAVKGGAHPYAGTVLGRLSIFGALADAEVEAGFRVAEIVGRYERVSGAPRRTCASPAYERGFGFSLEGQITADANLVRRFERRVRQARRSYEHLLDHIPERARDAVFTVCVEDREINSLLHKDLATVLRRLAVSFGFAVAPRARKARGARAAEAGPLAGALVDLLERWFADHRAAVVSFRLDTADPDIPALVGYGLDRAGADVSHAVALARGEAAPEDLAAAIVKAALAKGWSERGAGGR